VVVIRGSAVRIGAELRGVFCGRRDAVIKMGCERPENLKPEALVPHWPFDHDYLACFLANRTLNIVLITAMPAKKIPSAESPPLETLPTLNKA